MQLTRLLSIAICVTFALRCVAASADPAAAELARALDKKAVELFQSGRYEEAAAHVKRALVIWNDLSPDYRVEVSVAHYNLGQSYLAQGKLTEAERHARTASQLAEGCTTPAIRSRITVLIANIHFQAGEYAEAERQLRAAVPYLEGVEKATGLTDLAMTRAALGDLAAAQGLLDSSIAILEEAGEAAGPDHGWVLANLALIRSLQGDLSAAATLFSQAIPLLEGAPGLPPMYAGAALAQYSRVLRKLGRKSEAKTFEQRAKVILGDSMHPFKQTIDIRSLR